jgi:tRNA nucleotidyltransferase/poly(A) polymerase
LPTQLHHILDACPWLDQERLEVCVVGSQALAEACRREGVPGPEVKLDLDLAWRLDVAEGKQLFAEHGIEVTTTPNTEARGTLGAKISDTRVEITSFRGSGSTRDERIANDACLRDMTIGAVYWHLASDAIVDPLEGLDDWRAARIRACGSARERILEHPGRALRYLRKAVQFGFAIEPATRKAVRELGPEIAAGIPHEVLSEEIRRVLLTCSSPGVFFQMCEEERLLERLLPEIAPMFDGRPAGRTRHHPEVSQSLHVILCLAAAARVAERNQMSGNERVHLQLAVLCHDLGKGKTEPEDLPSHPGHEGGGVSLVHDLFERLPGLGGKRTRRLCATGAETHLLLADLRRYRFGTIVELFERCLFAVRDDFDNLARVVRCDREGRLTPAQLSLPTPPGAADRTEDFDAFEVRIRRDLHEVDAILRTVSGEESQRRFPDDPARLRADLHERRCVALRKSGFLRAQ